MVLNLKISKSSATKVCIGFGILMSALGIGSLTGALFLAFSGRGARPRQILVTAVILGVAELLLAVVSTIPLHVAFALLVLPIMGFAMSAPGASITPPPTPGAKTRWS